MNLKYKSLLLFLSFIPMSYGADVIEQTPEVVAAQAAVVANKAEAKVDSENFTTKQKLKNAQAEIEILKDGINKLSNNSLIMSLATLGTLSGMVSVPLKAIADQMKFITDNFSVIALPDGTYTIFSKAELQFPKTNAKTMEEKFNYIMGLTKYEIEYLRAASQDLAA